jgi:hypothetical protein
MADQQITGDPIVDALIAARQKEPQPFVESKPYDLGAQINSGFDAAKNLVDRYTQNMTEANRSAGDLQRLAIENMRSGSPGRMLLGAGQNVLAPIAGVMSPLTGGIETARQGIEYRMGAPFGNAFEVAANIAQGPEDVVNAARLAARSTPTIAHATDIAPAMAMTMIPGKAGESAIRAEQAAEDASKSVPTTTTVDPAIEKAQQANKDLAPEAIAKTVAVEPTVTPPKDAKHAQIAEVGHEMGTERGERRVIKETSIRLTPEEKAIVNNFSSPAEKAKIAGAIRATKVRYPVSDGWMPLELVGAELNEKGLPELQWRQPAYGFNRNVQEVEKVVKDSAGNPITFPAKDRSGIIKLDDYGDPIDRSLKWPVKEERSMKRGTSEYDKAVNKATNNSYKEIEDVIRRAAEGDDAAKVILRQVGWYREFMRKGFDERGGAYPAFSDILGATSPNTAVDQNYAYTVDAQKRFARGDFDPQVDFASKYQGSLTAFPEEQLIRREVVDPKTGELKQYGMNSRNAQMAMADLWRQQEEGQAPKARNFSGNLGGATDAATIDVWAARHIQRMLGRKRLPPPAEGGVKGKMMMTAPDNPVGPFGPMPMTLKAGGEFGFGQDVYGKLADKVNQNQILRPYLEQLGYTDITPMDLQALTWFIEKEHWTKNNWTTKAGEGGSFEDEMSKFPSRRWQSGFSISQGDTPPTNEMMAQTRNVVEGSLKNDDDVMVYRVHPTYGRYGGYDERSFDVELTAKPDWNPTNWMASIISEAQKNNQYDVFFSKRLDPVELKINSNARPGVEIYFQNRKDMDEILPILDEFTRRGQDGFTFTTDLRNRERISGGEDSPDYVGVRLQYVPEIRMRFDEDFRNAVVNDPQVLQDDLKLALSNMQNAINALDRSGAKIVDARVHHYDTLAVGKESYDDFLKGIADLENASSEYERSARGTNPVARFGRPISSHVEGRDRALRAGYGQAAPDASTAVEQPNLGITEPNKSRGGSAFASGGRSLGNNALGNALRMARLSNDEIEMPRSLKELQAIKKLRPAKNTDMDSMFTSRMSGIEGAEPVAMPADLNELLAYLRTRHSSGGRSHYDDGGDVRGGDSPFMSRSDYGLREAPTPSFRQAEDRSMREYERAVESGWSPTDDRGGGGASTPSTSPESQLTGRQSGFEGAPSVAMPSSIGELLAYNRNVRMQQQQSQQQQQAEQEATDQRIRDALAMAGVGATKFGDTSILPSGFPPVEKQEVIWGGGLRETPAWAANKAVELSRMPNVMGLPAGTALARTEMPVQAEYYGAPQETPEQMFARGDFGPQINAQFASAGSPYAVTPSAPQTMFAGTQPAFPHTPTPQQVSQVASAPDVRASFVQPNRPITLTPQPTIEQLTQAAPQQVAQNVPLPPTVARDPIAAAVAAASAPVEVAEATNPLAQTPDALVLPGRKAAQTVPMPMARPTDLPQAGLFDKIRSDLNLATGQRINELEAANQYAGGSPEQVAAALGVSPDALKARIINQDGKQVVDYYTKDLMDALFGPKTQNQQVVDAVAAAREGVGGRDQQQATVAPATVEAAKPPFMTELSAGNLALPHVDGLTAQQWANANTGGDLNKVHARIVYRDGAPRLEYYTV